MVTSPYTHKGKYLRTLIKLIGGKTKTRDILYALEPEGVISFAEPFLGSGSILVGKRKHNKEVANDINFEVINLFQMIQYAPDILYDVIQGHIKILKVIGKSYFLELRSNIPDDLIARAAWFYVLSKVSMNGIWRTNKAGQVNSSYCGQTSGRGFLDPVWYELIRERIKNVEFTCEDYKQTLLKAEPGTWVICDSPYSDNKTVYNADRWNHDRFEEYKETLERSNTRWLVTINDNEFIRDLFKDYEMHEAEYFYSCSQSSAGRGLKKELLISSYPIESLLDTYYEQKSAETNKTTKKAPTIQGY